jgi:hypothetical protein
VAAVRRQLVLIPPDTSYAGRSHGVDVRHTPLRVLAAGIPGLLSGSAYGINASRRPQDAIQISTDQHALLHRAHVPGPYALAGPSFGGPYVLTFRRHLSRRGRRNGRHRHHSTGDQAEEHQRRRRQLHDPLDRASALLSMSARLGVTRLYSPFERGSLPPT